MSCVKTPMNFKGSGLFYMYNDLGYKIKCKVIENWQRPFHSHHIVWNYFNTGRISARFSRLEDELQTACSWGTNFLSTHLSWLLSFVRFQGLGVWNAQKFPMFWYFTCSSVNEWVKTAIPVKAGHWCSRTSSSPSWQKQYGQSLQ